MNWFGFNKLGVLDRAMVKALFVIFLSVSIVCILGGLALGIKTVWFVATASKAEGVVVAHEHGVEPGSGKSLPRPVFTYTNNAGLSQTITQTTTSVFHDWPVGSSVKVLYSPGQPNRAEIGALSLLFFGPIFLIVLGVIGGVFILLWRFLFRRFAGV